jgi:hypothetical protein
MSTLVKRKPPKAVEVWFEEKKLLVRIEDGREVAVPLEWFPKLRDATPRELDNWSFIGNGIGIHWKDLDEDLSIEGLLH